MWSEATTLSALGQGGWCVEKPAKPIAPALPYQGSRERASAVTHGLTARSSGKANIHCSRFSTALLANLQARICSVAGPHPRASPTLEAGWRTLDCLSPNKGSPIGGDTLHFSHSLLIASLIKPAAKGRRSMPGAQRSSPWFPNLNRSHVTYLPEENPNSSVPTPASQEGE